jgi:hypothetical protein
MTVLRFAGRHALVAWLGTLTLVSACGKNKDNGTPTANWLRACTRDSECLHGLSCTCGVCTIECTGATDCLAFGDLAVCAPGSTLKSSCRSTLCLKQEPVTEGSGGEPGSGGAGAGGANASGGASASGGGTASGGTGGRTSIPDASADASRVVEDGAIKG